MANDDFFDNIEEYLKKTNIEFDILFVDYITKDKIALLVNKILNKYNIEKYYDDVIYILMELISNAVKARYLHLISLKILSEMYPNYSLDEYYTNPEIMKKYSDIFRDDDSREKLKSILKYENKIISSNKNIDIDNFYNDILLLNESTKKKFIIKLFIRITKNNIEFDVVNDSPLIILGRTRIDSKRLTFKEYYNNNMVESFFLEQLDNSESAGFGLALCDLRLYNIGLEPTKYLEIYDDDNKTHSKLTIPIKSVFSHLIFHNKY
ncbi:hypothetical protein [uncultured Brachyspira sp.]|uniref:hypothetical protein n=1 Tax=uncultured Brachyspira sp. TaxID=221953 RepID=UPI0026086A75|nr:hypothetical protein [uncultured Brachyspira sp.]